MKALRALTTGPIYVAGRPAELADTFATSGATGFIYAGCDAVAILQDALAAAVASPRDRIGLKYRAFPSRRRLVAI